MFLIIYLAFDVMNGKTVSCTPPCICCGSAVRHMCDAVQSARPVPMEPRRSSRQEAAAASLTHGEDVGLDVATAPLCD